MAIGVKTTPRVEFGRSTEVSKLGRSEPSPQTARRNADALPDGRFIGVTNGGAAASGSAASRIEVVLNWFEELKQRVPTK